MTFYCVVAGSHHHQLSWHYCSDLPLLTRYVILALIGRSYRWPANCDYFERIPRTCCGIICHTQNGTGWDNSQGMTTKH